MKIKFLSPVLFLALILSFPESSGQTYHTMLGNNNEWNIISTFESTITLSYWAFGDTTINGVEYKILGGDGYPDPIAFLREDSLNRKIYFRTGDFLADTVEYILYDFSLNVDDSIMLYSLSYWELDNLGYYHIDSINNITLNGEKHQKYFLSAEPYVYPDRNEKPIWIEGIGSLGELLHPGISVDLWNLGELSCFYKNGVQLYHSLNFDSCFIFQSGIDNSLEKEDIIIYPNPCTNVLNIESRSRNILVVEVYNPQGFLLYQEVYENEEKIVMKTDFMDDGLYFIRIKNDENQIVKPFIKLGER